MSNVGTASIKVAIYSRVSTTEQAVAAPSL